MAELHPESKSLLDMLKKMNRPSYDEADNVEEARTANRQLHQFLAGKFEYQGEVRDTVIPSEHNKDGIPVTVYRPLPAADRPAFAYKHGSLEPKPAILVYFHGGGMVIGSRESADMACRVISARSYAIVVNVEYRLAPENKFPAMMEDAETAVKWVIKNKVMLGGMPDSAVGVSGDSAGGTISASVCHTVPGIDFQVLIYPQVDLRNRFESYKKYADGYLLTQKLIDWFHSKFITSEEDKTNPRLSPLCRDSFAGLPPALFIVAECDPLADDSFEYAKKLSAAGVRNEILLLRGAIHAFYTLPGHFMELTEKAYSKVADFIRNVS